MSRRSLAFVSLIALILAGCATTSSETSSGGQAISSDQLPEVRAEYLRANPGAHVALVISVLPSAMELQVGHARLADFSVGDVVSVVDSNNNVITNGSISDIRGEKITMHYAAPAKNLRGPRIGDLVIGFQ